MSRMGPLGRKIPEQSGMNLGCWDTARVRVTSVRPGGRTGFHKEAELYLTLWMEKNTGWKISKGPHQRQRQGCPCVKEANISERIF